MYDGNKNKYIKLIIFVCLITVFFIIYFLFKNDNLEIKMANETEYVELGQEKEIKVFLNGKESNDINLLSENIDVLDVVENNVVKPYVFGKFMDLHPIVIYIFLFVCAKYFGVIGAIFAPAIAADVCVFIEELYLKSMDE